MDSSWKRTAGCRWRSSARRPRRRSAPPRAWTSDFALQSFEFSLDPGTGPAKVRGDIAASSSRSTYHARSPERARERKNGSSANRRALSLNLSRRLANGGLVPGSRHGGRSSIPRRCAYSPVVINVGKRELRARHRRADAGVPRGHGVRRLAHDVVGDRHRRGRARGESARADHGARDRRMREGDGRSRPSADGHPRRRGGRADDEGTIDEPRDVRRLRMRLAGADLSGTDMQGVAQTVSGDVVEIEDTADAPTATKAIPISRATWRPRRSSRATRRRSSPRPKRPCAA